MNRCGDCFQFRNGCEFSESKLPEDALRSYVACHEFFSEKDFDKAMDKAYELAKKDIQ